MLLKGRFYPMELDFFGVTTLRSISLLLAT